MTVKKKRIILLTITLAIILLGGTLLGIFVARKHTLSQDLIQALNGNDLVKMEQLLKKGADPNTATSIFKKTFLRNPSQNTRFMKRVV